VDVRVVASSNRDLAGMVASGSFQEDLFYRLSVIPITIPPLRERREDIPILLEHFLDKHARRSGKPIPAVDDEALQALLRYEWPGNVRELENAVERAVVLSKTGRIGIDDVAILPVRAPASAGLPSLQLKPNVAWAERESIERALRQAGGTKKAAAELLGISQRALSYYLSKYGIR
jgi:transcriptional regulator with PAS, ATPase and Fis domain